MENPYQAGNLSNTAAPSHPTDEIVQALARTKPWVRLLAICGFIVCGLALLFLLAGLVQTGQRFNSSGGVTSMIQPVVQIVVSLVVLTGYLLLSIKLWKYGSAISRASQGNPAAVVDAIERQRSFWKLFGILALLGGLFLVMLLVLAFFTSPVPAA